MKDKGEATGVTGLQLTRVSRQSTLATAKV